MWLVIRDSDLGLGLGGRDWQTGMCLIVMMMAITYLGFDNTINLMFILLPSMGVLQLGCFGRLVANRLHKVTSSIVYIIT